MVDNSTNILSVLEILDSAFYMADYIKRLWIEGILPHYDDRLYAVGY